jgi:hypothetical protein
MGARVDGPAAATNPSVGGSTVIALLVSALLAAGTPQPEAKAATPSPWKQRDGDQWDLFLDGAHVGSYRTSTDTYWPALPGGRFGDATLPPVAVPAKAWPSKEVWDKLHGRKEMLTGVISEKIEGPAYSTNSGALSRQQAFDKLNHAAASMLRDDSGRIWVTVVGSEASRKPVEDYLKNHAGKEKMVVNGYGRDDWQVAPEKFGALPAGEPVVLIQGRAMPNGTAFAYWLQTSGSLADVERGANEALRRADPNWKPDRVPGPNNVLRPMGGDWIVWGVLGVVVVLFLVAFVLIILFVVAVVAMRRKKGK